jgi:MFS family permease
MRTATAALIVFTGGFIIMVLEIIGARFLARYFGSEFHIWVSQIGVVLVALSVGYFLGGSLADRWQRLSWVAFVLLLTAVLLFLVPTRAGPILEGITARHPVDQSIPYFWQKADPVLGSALVFLLPCLVLATLSPYMIRLATQNLAQIGRSSGFIIAAGTVGSIAGVFVAGFWFIDQLRISTIFQLMSGLTALLALLCLAFDVCWLSRSRRFISPQSHVPLS